MCVYCMILFWPTCVYVWVRVCVCAAPAIAFPGLAAPAPATSARKARHAALVCFEAPLMFLTEEGCVCVCVCVCAAAPAGLAGFAFPSIAPTTSAAPGVFPREGGVLALLLF
ncbi:MAG: hypothetical protein P4L40_24495 [Terracidiphilus sp.]|nr:hypothetical protein [Terracidiphilus sp.]